MKTRLSQWLKEDAQYSGGEAGCLMWTLIFLITAAIAGTIGAWFIFTALEP